jgi:hypothetical protein
VIWSPYLLKVSAERCPGALGFRRSGWEGGQYGSGVAYAARRRLAAAITDPSLQHVDWLPGRAGYPEQAIQEGLALAEGYLYRRGEALHRGACPITVLVEGRRAHLDLGAYRASLDLLYSEQGGDELVARIYRTTLAPWGPRDEEELHRLALAVLHEYGEIPLAQVRAESVSLRGPATWTVSLAPTDDGSDWVTGDGLSVELIAAALQAEIEAAEERRRKGQDLAHPGDWCEGCPALLACSSTWRPDSAGLGEQYPAEVRLDEAEGQAAAWGALARRLRARVRAGLLAGDAGQLYELREAEGREPAPDAAATLARALCPELGGEDPVLPGPILAALGRIPVGLAGIEKAARALPSDRRGAVFAATILPTTEQQLKRRPLPPKGAA